MNRPPKPGPLEYLAGLEFIGIKFGLDNITALLAELGNPHQAYRTLHVAGTNGKGSVTAMADTALREAGYRCARYTSPHLVRLNERFAIDGLPVGDNDLEQAIADVRTAIEQLQASGVLEVEPTFFEVTTAVGFELFRRAGVQVAVIEVGLGGRLDATNVITPVATAITSIGLDHEKYLGGTIRDIAAEKAGIIKPGIPVIVGALRREAREVIAEIARSRQAPFMEADEGVLGTLGVDRLGLRGGYQRQNAAIAATLLQAADARGLRVPSSAIRTGLTSVRWPGRLDLRRLRDGRELLMDAAHNPDGAAALADYIRETWPVAPKPQGGEGGPPLVFAAMRDKDMRGMLAALLPAVGSVVLTRASNARAADPAELAALVREVAPGLPLTIEPSPAAALEVAWRQGSPIVVAGSIFLLGDVLKVIDAP